VDCLLQQRSQQQEEEIPLSVPWFTLCYISAWHRDMLLILSPDLQFSEQFFYLRKASKALLLCYLKRLERCQLNAKCELCLDPDVNRRTAYNRTLLRNVGTGVWNMCSDEMEESLLILSGMTMAWCLY
jgi:hypothetical protein